MSLTMFESYTPSFQGLTCTNLMLGKKSILLGARALSTSFSCLSYYQEFGCTLLPRNRTKDTSQNKYIKHLMAGPKGNSELFSLRPSMLPEGKQNSLFPVGPAVKCFVISHSSKIEQIIYIIYGFICLTPAGTLICRVFKVHDLITCESKVQVVVSLGS